MPIQCTICLNDIDDAVCVPCGHMYCSNCLYQHIQSTVQGAERRCICPNCRVPFLLVAPETAHLPRAMREAMNPTIRRVFFEYEEAESNQQAELDEANQRIEQLTEELRATHELRTGAKRSAARYRLAASNAVARAENLQAQLIEVTQARNDAEVQCESLEIQLEDARVAEQANNLKLKTTISTLREKAITSLQSKDEELAAFKAKYRTLKKTYNDYVRSQESSGRSHDENSSAELEEPPAKRTRISRHLPVRTATHRARSGSAGPSHQVLSPRINGIYGPAYSAYEVYE